MKKVKFVIDKKGNFTAETLEGFSGNSCNKTLNEIVTAIGGAELVDKEDKPDRFKDNSIEQFISNI